VGFIGYHVFMGEIKEIARKNIVLDFFQTNRANLVVGHSAN
jgi:hypothetical protein